MGIRPRATAIDKNGKVYRTEESKSFYGSQEENERQMENLESWQKEDILFLREIIDTGGVVIWDTDIDGYRISTLTDSRVEIRNSFLFHKKELKRIFNQVGISFLILKDKKNSDHTMLVIGGEQFHLYYY